MKKIFFLYFRTRNPKSWLLFNAKWTIFQPYYIERKLHFDDMMIMFTLY
jgi:hypothetical protein